MRIWPFGSRETHEEGAGGGEDAYRAAYTELVLDAAYTAAVGAEVDRSLASGVEAARGAVGRAFAAAEWESAPSWLTAVVMREIGRSLIYPGQSVWTYRTGAGLVRAASWDAQGDDRNQSYELEIPGPGSSVTIRRPRAQVAHFTWSSGQGPWDGVGPIGRAITTGELGAQLERVLARELGGSHGYLLPVPVDPDSPETDKLKADLRALDGRTTLVRSTVGGWGHSQHSAGNQPYRDWVPSRLGANPPEVLVRIREAVQESVMGMCGVPAAVGGADNRNRESWRQFQHGTVEPLGRTVEQELVRVFGGVVSGLSFRRLGAADVAGNARAYHVLVQAGMSAADALRYSGLEGRRGA